MVSTAFGSLLWPRRLHLKDSLPVFLSGGTLDLITPPLSEQLGLLRALPFHPDSRAVLVEGIILPHPRGGQNGTGRGEDVFQLGEELVGVQPLQVQAQLELEISQFLLTLENDQLSADIPGGIEH